MKQKNPWTTENSYIKIMKLSNLEIKLIWPYALQGKYKGENFNRELKSTRKRITEKIETENETSVNGLASS